MFCLRAPWVGGSLSLSAICLQNRCHRCSGILTIWMPFGAYAAETNVANKESRSSVILVASKSICKALTTSPYALRQQVIISTRTSVSGEKTTNSASFGFCRDSCTPLHGGSAVYPPFHGCCPQKVAQCCFSHVLRTLWWPLYTICCCISGFLLPDTQSYQPSSCHVNGNGSFGRV